MSVYVDGLMTHAGRQWCHMLADTPEELEAMARKLGLKPHWRQNAGKPNEHYDLSAKMRGRALELGATSIHWRQAGALVKAKQVAANFPIQERVLAHARRLAARPQKTAAAPRKAER